MENDTLQARIGSTDPSRVEIAVRILCAQWTGSMVARADYRSNIAYAFELADQIMGIDPDDYQLSTKTILKLGDRMELGAPYPTSDGGRAVDLVLPSVGVIRTFKLL